MDKSAARGGWLRRPAADRLAEPLRSHELSSLNQLELLLMHKETYAKESPRLIEFLYASRCPRSTKILIQN